MPENKLTLATWNVCRGPFAKKAKFFLERHSPDFVVFQEIRKPKDEDHLSFPGYQVYWYGNSELQGIAIAVRNHITLTPLPLDDRLPQNTRPFMANHNSVEFLVLSVWTHPDPSYTGSLHRSLVGYKDLLLKYPSVVMGDFNASVALDSPKNNHTKFVDVNRELNEELGLWSAWHRFSGDVMGQETKPTLYFQHSPEKPFHIDYVYTPKTWQVEQCQIGSYEDWKGLSDHRPIVANMVLPEVSSRIWSSDQLGETDSVDQVDRSEGIDKS